MAGLLNSADALGFGEGGLWFLFVGLGSPTQECSALPPTRSVLGAVFCSAGDGTRVSICGSVDL